MMLSRRINNPFSVEHAEHAVEILDVEVRGMVSAEEFPEDDLEEARGLLELAKQRSAAAEEGDKPVAPVEEREGEGEAEDQGESGAVPSMEELRTRCRDARSAVKSLGLREDEAVLEWNDRLLDAFSNDDSDESARRQLFAVIKELTQYVKNAAAQVDVEAQIRKRRSLADHLAMINSNSNTGVEEVGEEEGGFFLARSQDEDELILR
ncbi:hypothetical protein LTR74_016738 [Friedmanniomyces endolithicus]|nr:hypothetical protein LTR74_016738 [Friedmanniomyces endolithicus]